MSYYDLTTSPVVVSGEIVDIPGAFGSGSTVSSGNDKKQQQWQLNFNPLHPSPLTVTSTGPTCSLDKWSERAWSWTKYVPGCSSSCSLLWALVKTGVLRVVLEVTVILYPWLGGGEGAVQETLTSDGEICSATRSVGASAACLKGYQFKIFVGSCYSVRKFPQPFLMF